MKRIAIFNRWTTIKSKGYIHEKYEYDFYKDYKPSHLKIFEEELNARKRNKFGLVGGQTFDFSKKRDLKKFLKLCLNETEQSPNNRIDFMYDFGTEIYSIFKKMVEKF